VQHFWLALGHSISDEVTGGGGGTILGKSSKSFQIIQTDLEMMGDDQAMMEANLGVMEDNLESMEGDQKW
jgi:hypothetical protein